MFDTDSKPLQSSAASFPTLDQQTAARLKQLELQARGHGSSSSLLGGVRNFIGVFFDALNGRYDR